MRAPELPPELLARKAVVYVRQSTLAQVHGNLESQRRQYELVELARRYGFREVEVIDKDLGVSATGRVERLGFQSMVAQLCTGAVGAVLCLEASRLARNGRDWHHLLELCGVVGARVIDADGLYDPRHPNDRLLLGLKGTMSEFELTVLRTRLVDAKVSKARRGELRFPVPIGYCWSRDGALELDPDRRVQEIVRLVFRRFLELGSGRQVLLWMRREGLSFPTPSDGKRMSHLTWRPPRYRHVMAILTNPFYAGVYAYGKSEHRTMIVDGHPRKTYGHGKPMEDWGVCIREHHPGYISWAEYERNQAALARNSFCKPSERSKSGRGGHALLIGLLRCRRCGRRLRVHYSGYNIRYNCKDGVTNFGVVPCINFGARRPDAAVAHAVLEVVHPLAIEAAMKAEDQLAEQEAQRHRALELELEQARYDARLAERRYETCDPDNRLVAAELEVRWNTAMRRLRDCEQRLERIAEAPPELPDHEKLVALAGDLEAVWNHPSTGMKHKQRIVRVLIEEIVVDVDASRREVILLIHWRGGQHSELRVKKPRSGEHTRQAAPQSLDIIKQMAGTWSDTDIAATLNRMGLTTGQGNSWTASSVASARRKRGIAAYAPAYGDGAWFTMRDAAAHVGVTSHVIRHLIVAGILPASQVIQDAPWQIRAAHLQLPAVQRALEQAKSKSRRPCRNRGDDKTLIIPGFSGGDV
jgi:DNA invertase Pin-like site-specific DNA recombinase